jgi:Protein of unknown function (DUF3011)/Peptidase inhibitor family I36
MKIRLLLIAAFICSWSVFPHHAFARTAPTCAYGNLGSAASADVVDADCPRIVALESASTNGAAQNGNTITCESKNNKRNYCRISNSSSNVELVQQLSQSPCNRGQSWGNDGQGIWVDRGCRATFRVSSYGGDGPGWWNSGPGHHPSNQPKNGACFFRQANYTSDYFCIARGSSVSAVQSGFNDQISSIRLYGGARVTVYNDANFRSTSISFRNSVSDLRNVRLQGNDNKTWNNRISSIQVN